MAKAQLLRCCIGLRENRKGSMNFRDRRENVAAAVSRSQQARVSPGQAKSFSPAMPQTIRPMQPMRMAVAGSWNSSMPRIAAPTVPMPVQTA